MMPEQPLPPQAQPPQAPAPAKQSLSTCLIVGLVVVGVVVFFGGILATLAIYGVRKYIANAKTAEARNELGVIEKCAAAAYAIERPSTRGPTHRLCPSASRPIPPAALSVSGKKYASTSAEWDVDRARDAGFACLGFTMSQPQYYRYSYRAHGVSQAGDGFDAVAEGDLNGDGVTSQFRVSGQVDSAGRLNVAPSILETNPTE